MATPAGFFEHCSIVGHFPRVNVARPSQKITIWSMALHRRTFDICSQVIYSHYLYPKNPDWVGPSWSHLSRWLNHEVPSEGPTRPQSPQKAKSHENVGISEYIKGLTDHSWDFIGESWHPNPTPVLQLLANHFHFLHTWLRWFHIVRKPNTAGPWDILAFWKFSPQFLQRKWYHHLISFQSSSWNGWSMGCPGYPTHLPNEWFRGQ